LKKTSIGLNLIAKTTIYTLCCFKNVGVPGTPQLIKENYKGSEIHFQFEPDKNDICEDCKDRLSGAVGRRGDFIAILFT
jgi:hypothetical protein